jgi:hypothetical protein
MDLKQILREGDPIAREPALDAFHAQSMRQRVMLEVAEREGFSRAGVTEREGFVEREGFTRAFTLWWLRPVAVAGALAACLAAGVGLGLRITTGDGRPYVERPFQGRGPDSAPPRQLQFATPGGTRIIWTFHQEFDL